MSGVKGDAGTEKQRDAFGIDSGDPAEPGTPADAVVDKKEIRFGIFGIFDGFKCGVNGEDGFGDLLITSGDLDAVIGKIPGKTGEYLTWWTLPSRLKSPRRRTPCLCPG